MNVLGADDRAPLTLMSADVERISAGLGYLHDVWGSVVEVAIAIWLLWRELDVPAVAALIISSVCVIVAMLVGKASGGRQHAWIETVQRRLTFTASALQNVKEIKLAGIVECLSSSLEELRLDEVRASRNWRKLQVLMVAVGFFNSALAPVISLSGYILSDYKGNGVLTVAKAMTTLSIFALVGAPINLLSESASGLFTAVACIERIRKYLAMPDRRLLVGQNTGTVFEETGTSQLQHLRDEENWTYQARSKETEVATEERTEEQPCIRLDQLSLGWTPEGDAVVRNLDLSAPTGSLTVILGPVGCGKSTILSGILGENFRTQGNIHVSARRIAYCSQTPWVTNATVRDNILGCSPYDKDWYEEVIRRCGLEHDIGSLPHGDQTMLGSGGSAVSGGQKQRVSLARAVYSMATILLLDDVLSGVDAATEGHIFQHLFGPDGLLRRQQRTVILTSSSRTCIQIADMVVWLNSNGHISSQETVLESQALSNGIENKITAHEKSLPRTKDAEPGHDAQNSTEFEIPTNRRVGDWAVFRYYALRIGPAGMLLFLTLMMIFVFFYGFPSIWVELWAEASGKRTAMYVGIYYALAVLQISLIVASAA
ncbi:hypothetical protein AbraIFM66950_007464 [Aspergillus brasiliensis]|nr:hypothetical protein AbraIFM66950_007464 [Aspergillus brasiliensis]